MNPDSTQGLEAGPAVFSGDRLYRYSLSRTWSAGKPSLMYIGLNPSTADEVRLDPTLRRCLDFARSFGYGTFHMTNLFAFRATQPNDMRAAADPVGPQNDDWLIRFAAMSDLVVAAWGVNGDFRERDREVFSLLHKRGFPIKCFGLSKDGHPKHPLYLHRSTQLIPYRGLRF